MTPSERLQHVTSLCEELGVHWDRLSPSMWLNSQSSFPQRFMRAPNPVESPYHLICLHELGHLALRHMFYDYTPWVQIVWSELGAWDWAITAYEAQGLVLTEPDEAVIMQGINSYLKDHFRPVTFDEVFTQRWEKWRDA